MAGKLQFYRELSEHTISELTRQRGNWMRFLDTAARMYKYSFPEQALIHAQRPSAVAVAPIELWNDSFDRWVRRGSKGVALIDDTGMYPRLKYVFDAADTEPSRYNARPVRPWELRQEHKAPVMAELAKAYDIDENGTLAEAFRNIAGRLASEYYDDNARDIRYRAENSYLEAGTVYDPDGIPYEDADDGTLGSAFTEALSKSIAYCVMARCGLDVESEFDDGDFQIVIDFNTPDMAYALGTASNELSKQVLRDVELTVRKYERVKAAQMAQNAERSNENHDRNPYLQPSRGLSSAGFGASGTAERGHAPAGEIRPDEESVPQRPQDNQLQPPADDGETLSAPLGNRPGGKPEARNGDGGASQTEQPAGQGGRPVGVDGGDEQPESAGGGNGAKRADLQLNETESPPEPEGRPEPGFSQVGKSAIAEILSASAITTAEADSVLRDGGNSGGSVFRIAARFAKGQPGDADYLKREYLQGKPGSPPTLASVGWKYGRSPSESGKGFRFDGSRHSVSAWFSDDGITLAVGSTAKNNMHRVTVPWDRAALRVNELMAAGEYISADRFDEALDNERLELAGRLWFFYRDDMGFLPDEWQAEKGGYPEDEAAIKALLDDPDGRQAILDRLESDVAQFDYDEHERVWHNPDRLLADMKAAMLPPKIFPNGTFRENKDFKRFITQDETDAFLARGSQFNEGKFRTLSVFLSNTSSKERIDFLKNEYGTGGGTWSEGNGWSDYSPSDGITLKRDGTIFEPEASVTLTWNAAMRRIEKLIGDGRYMTRAELDSIPQYERLLLVRELNGF
jgi:hypothetical protein